MFLSVRFVEFFRKYHSSIKDKSKPEFRVAICFKLKLRTGVNNSATRTAF